MDKPLKALQELGDEFERVEREQPPPRRARRRRRRLPLLVVPGMLVVAAAAMAASAILTGEPVRNPPGLAFRADEGLGKPKPATIDLLDLRVADPDGGPPWGMRTLRTTRGLGCVQVGRVVDDKLGVLGQDGAFGNDGRFHELPADVLTQAQCQQPDGAGHVFLAVSYQGLPASALAGACRLSGVGKPPRPSGAPRRPAQPRCPAADERILYFGLLGPRGRSVTYDDATGREITARTHGPDRGYLVVLRPSATRRPSGRFVPSPTPLSGLASVHYDDAPICRIRSPRALGGAKPCPPVGYVAPSGPRVNAGQVSTPVRATVSRKPVKPPWPRVPVGVEIPRMWKLTIAFRARLSADAQRLYLVGVRPRSGAGCRAVSSGSVNRDVDAGEVVRYTTYLPSRCRGTVRGIVTYRPQPDGPEQVPAFLMVLRGVPEGQAVVGRFSVDLPG